MKSIALGTATVMFIALSAAGAYARGVTPLNGKPWIPNEDTCFSSGWNQLTNSSCSGYRKWLVDAVLDNSNNYHDFNVAGRGTGTTVVKCWAVSNTSDGLSGWSVYADRASTSWGWLNKAAATIWVPSAGAMHFDCDIPQTGGVSAFHWTP
ncbi:hypothetical protein [Sorangium sp. So ce388]|uniref:hypothetical protein n=1 Tax=Sorangium sp. So ce388 TaxID=3133309 RepID=UPI003F5C101D